MQIRGRNIRYRYADEPSYVFSDLCFSITGPGLISLFGLSGTGKSTIARIISGELIPEAGTIVRPGNSTILYSHNAERLPGWCSVGEHVESITPEENHRLRKALIHEFGIGSIMNSRFRELSMGQKNRINLLRYLVQDFDMLIADEVLANVDEPTRNHILAVIKKRFSSKTFLYISHNAIEVARFSKTVLVLPVNSADSQALIKKVPGLDSTREETEPMETLQKTVMRLLQAAASGRADPVGPMEAAL